MNRNGLLRLQMMERNYNQNSSFDFNAFSSASDEIDMPSYPVKEILQFLDGKTNKMPNINSVSSFAIKNSNFKSGVWSLYAGVDIRGTNNIRLFFSIPKYRSEIADYDDYEYELTLANVKKEKDLSKYPIERVEFVLKYLEVLEQIIREKRSVINKSLNKDIDVSEKDIENTKIIANPNNQLLKNCENEFDAPTGKSR